METNPTSSRVWCCTGTGAISYAAVLFVVTTCRRRRRHWSSSYVVCSLSVHVYRVRDIHAGVYGVCALVCVCSVCARICSICKHLVLLCVGECCYCVLYNILLMVRVWQNGREITAESRQKINILYEHPYWVPLNM